MPRHLRSILVSALVALWTLFQVVGPLGACRCVHAAEAGNESNCCCDASVVTPIASSDDLASTSVQSAVAGSCCSSRSAPAGPAKATGHCPGNGASFSPRCACAPTVPVLHVPPVSAERDLAWAESMAAVVVVAVLGRPQERHGPRERAALTRPSWSPQDILLRTSRLLI